LDKRFHLVAFIVRAVSAAVIFASVLYTFFVVAPAIETRFFPVVGKLNILSHVTDPATGATTLMASFTKLRDCEYVGLSWTHILPDGKQERVPIILGRKQGDTSSPNRPVGQTSAGPWVLPLSWDEIQHHSFAQLYHRCSPLWATTTEFYP
jgi:hypothetical protein